MSKAVLCIANLPQAERIVDRLKIAGFLNTDISVLLADKSGTRDFAHEHHTKSPEGAAAGAGTGAVIGGALGWLAGMSCSLCTQRIQGRPTPPRKSSKPKEPTTS